MGPHYRSDFIGADVGAGCSIAMNETPRRSPRILITRACSEDSQDGGSPMLRKPFLVNALPCDSVYLYFSKFLFLFSRQNARRYVIVILYFRCWGKEKDDFSLLRERDDSRFAYVCRSSERRWRHCSTGSDSSTGSSEASVWTTGVAQKLAKANAKSSSDMWSASRRLVRGKNLEEGALLVGARPSNNSESSDTTDTTATTTTTTMPSKLTTVVSKYASRRTHNRIQASFCRNVLHVYRAILDIKNSMHGFSMN